MIGCLLTRGLAFKKRTMSALSLELFTWKSPSGASLTHPHDPRQQNMECISNPAQKYEYKSRGFYREYLMCDGSLFTVWIYSTAALDCRFQVMHGRSGKVHGSFVSNDISIHCQVIFGQYNYYLKIDQTHKFVHVKMFVKISV